MQTLEVSQNIILMFDSQGRLTSIVSVMQVRAIHGLRELVEVPCSKVLGAISVWKLYL